MNQAEMLELQRKNCVFCKIINKEIPSHEIYSDDKVSIILDINPANEGHCLILPKEHYQIMPQIPKEIISYMFIMAKRTSKLLLKSLAVHGTTIFVANGAVAGQKAPHFMIHVIPRTKSDMLFDIPKNPAGKGMLEELKIKLRAKLGYKTEAEETEPEKKEEKKKVDLDKISEMFT